MKALRTLFARVTGMFRGHQADDDMRAEMEAHLDMEIAEFVRRGLSPDEARRQALLASGGLTQAAEAVREQRGLPWIENLVADLRYATRSLRHSPSFTLIVIITLALGIGANTAIFSVVRAVVLKPLPHHDGEKLVYLRQSMDGPGGENILFSVPEIQDLQGAAKSFSGLAQYSPFTFTLRGEQDAVRLIGGLVTGNYFEVMGLSPILGRVTERTDDGPGAAPVMVLTYDYWHRRFNGDSSVVGTAVNVDGRLVTVIGVMEPAPYFPDRVDVFLNLVNSEHHLSASMVTGRTHRMTELVGRLVPDATVSQARAEVSSIFERMMQENAGAYDPGAHHQVAVMPFRKALGSRAEMTLWLLVGAAAFSMIIAAANVANLTLMRGVRREPELVARAALGAGASRLRRMLLAENLLLTTLGGVVGVLFALGGVQLLIRLVDRYSARASEIHLDGTVLGFTLLLSVTLAVVLSYIASLPKEGAFAAMISAGGRRISGSFRRQRLQRALVVTQVAVSVVLMAGAGLLTRTMMRLSQVDTGLNTEEVLSMDVQLLERVAIFAPGADAAAKERYYRILQQIRALPGVLDAGIGSPGPLRRSTVIFEVKAEGKGLASGEAQPRAELRTAGPNFFSASGIPVVKGRAFNETDQPNSGLVVVINQALADRMFPGEDAVGKQIAWTGQTLRFAPFTDDWRTIIGVISNTRDGGLDVESRPVMYMPFTQIRAIGGGYAIRAERNVANLVPAVTRIIRGVAPEAPIENVLTIMQIKDRSVAPRRLNAMLVSSFGLLAVIIAAVGIAGVLAFSVSARTTEIGIRMSLGADRWQVERMILGEGGLLLGIGLALGTVGAVLSARVIEGLLFGVEPHDPVTLAVVTSMMALIGVAACWIPALRAARIDPAITMRS